MCLNVSLDQLMYVVSLLFFHFIDTNTCLLKKHVLMTFADFSMSETKEGERGVCLPDTIII